MNLHLAEIAAEVAPGKHAVLVVDQAGWHLSAGLVVPDNITLVVLPPKCPELNPAENVWQFMRDRQAPGHPGKLNTAQREALTAMVESGPMPAIHGVVRWRLKDLAM